jgi:tRNA pseudouridine55 synthase
MEKLIKPFLLICKPRGITSRKFLNKISKVMHHQKMGYAGTLDPMATGILFIAIDRATRLIRYADISTKEYFINIKFGISTDTDDITGKVINRSENKFDLAELEKALDKFKGRIKQIPPVFSAKKIMGREMYKYAREGKTDLQLKPVEVEIFEIELREFKNYNAILRVVCSSGTYMRSLARDLGSALGTYGTLAAITRTGIGKFSVNDAATIRQIENNDLSKGFYDVDDVIDLPSITIKDSSKFINGMDVNVEHFLLRARSGKILGIGTLKGKVLHPEVIIDECD